MDQSNRPPNSTETNPTNTMNPNTDTTMQPTSPTRPNTTTRNRTTAMNRTQSQQNATTADMKPNATDSDSATAATPTTIESKSQRLAGKRINQASRLLAEACLLLDRDEITLTVVNIKAPIRPPVIHDGPSPSDFRKDEIAYFHATNDSGPFIDWVKAIWDDTGFVFATVGHGENERFITKPQPAVKHES